MVSFSKSQYGKRTALDQRQLMRLQTGFITFVRVAT